MTNTHMNYSRISKSRWKHIQTAIQKVSTSFPSLFSREDVIKLLMDLSADMQDEGPKPKIDLDILITTFRQVLSEKDWDDVVDKDEIELSMGYDNKVEVDRVTIDEDYLIGEVVDALEAVYNALDEEAN
jgi:ATP-dependent exoDNAse (exonuclease V) alpha subunit